MKKLVYKFFDEFYYSELVHFTDDTWVQLSVNEDFLGYDKSRKILYYNGNIASQITSIFSISDSDFVNMFKEWFEERYKLIVDKVM